MKTDDDLKKAFAGESQANRKYLAFAEKAEKEGFKGIAVLFRSVAEAETVHALRELSLLKGVNSTSDNLKAAITGEDYESNSMYPQFAKDAAEESNVEAKKSFDHAGIVEGIHKKLFEAAVAAVELKKDVAYKSMFVCQTCGYTSVENPGVCPVCGAVHFKEVK